MRSWLLIAPAAQATSEALLLARLACGSFLIFQSHDNVLELARMTEFAKFLELHSVWYPDFAARVSAYMQFVAGIGFVMGAFTRLLALVTLVHFVVAIAIVHLGQSYTLIWPALALVALAAVFSTVGAGRYSIDHVLVSGRAAGD